MMRRYLGVCLVALAACASDPADPADADGVSYVDIRDVPETGFQQLDILIVVDDTTAIAPYLDRLALIPALLEEAFPLPGTGVADLRFAVTTDGTLRTGPSGSILTLTPDYDLTRTASFSGTLRESLAVLMDARAERVANPEPLAAIARVIAENPQGFLRANAYLGIVIISGRDDASPGSIAEYVHMTKGVRPDPANVMVTGLIASPAPRLDEFFASFPNRGRSVSIVDGDMSTLFVQFAQLLKSTLGLPCWNASDVDLETPGTQYECTVTVTIRDQDRRVPPCRVEGDLFCWTMHPEPQCDINGDKGAVMNYPPWGHSLFRPRMRTECVVLR